MTSEKQKEKIRRNRVASLATVFVLLVTCHLSLVTGFALAQSQTTGRIVGTVKDQRGAFVVGAGVTVTSLATAEERNATTDAQGNYTVSFLPPGAYRVSVAANGFKKAEAERVAARAKPSADVAARVRRAPAEAAPEAAPADDSRPGKKKKRRVIQKPMGKPRGRVVMSACVIHVRPRSRRDFRQRVA